MIEAAVVAIMNKWYKLEMIEKWPQKKNKTLIMFCTNRPIIFQKAHKRPNKFELAIYMMHGLYSLTFWAVQYSGFDCGFTGLCELLKKTRLPTN